MNSPVESTVQTYRAVQAIEPGRLAPAELPEPTPGPGHVRVRVEACGVCRSDAITVEAMMPIESPRVPGHEAVGRIDAVGADVTGWAEGQRVGVGFLGGHCGHCAQCRRGDFVNCQDEPITGAHVDGGYAEVLIVRQTGLVAIPDELDSLKAAPLLCAGLTTFNALRNSGARAGELVAVLGIGGLGHLGVQYARRMGLRVVAIARGAEKEALARELGAHAYVNSVEQDPAAELSRLGGAPSDPGDRIQRRRDVGADSWPGPRRRAPRGGRRRRADPSRRVRFDLRRARARGTAHRLGG
jgi:propanol-preferring alcohol dehydrogenase